jgi:HD-GYP domain-containing protein (c-di-GMP phosphodiesterase class II)
MARTLRDSREAPQDGRDGRRGNGQGTAAPGEPDEGRHDVRGGDASVRPATGSAAQRPAPSPRGTQRTYRIRSDVRISSDTRDRFRQLVRGLPIDAAEDDEPSLAQRALSGLRSLLGGRGSDAPGAAEQPGGKPRGSIPDGELLETLPKGTRLKTYVDRVSVADELPRARQAMARSEETLGIVVADIRGGRIPQTEQVNEVVDHMVDSMIDNPDALLWVAQLREEHLQTYQHGVRVALYMIAMGRQLGFPRELLGNLGMIGMLADVGKIKLPRALLEKPGMLNPAEYGIIKEHVRLGLEALAQGGSFPAEVALGIAQHHERLDGSGYPKGMKGNEISIYGRMAAIADSFSALITPRPYANPLAPQDALMSLYQWAGSSFHGPLVEQFVQGVGVFPVGSMVELSSGEVAVVLAQNRVRRLAPRVLLLTAPDKRPLPAPVEKNLLNQPRDGASVLLRIVRGLPSGAYGLKLRDYYADELAAANRLV